MKRFNYDEDDENENLFPDTGDEDDFDEDDEDEDEYMTKAEIEAMERREALEMIQLEMVEKDLNQRLLFKCMKLLEKSYFWKFRSLKTKLKLIAETYHALRVVVQRPEMKEEKKNA